MDFQNVYLNIPITKMTNDMKNMILYDHGNA